MCEMNKLNTKKKFECLVRGIIWEFKIHRGWFHGYVIIFKKNSRERINEPHEHVHPFSSTFFFLIESSELKQI